jgi:site-specific recombinase XerD
MLRHQVTNFLDLLLYNHFCCQKTIIYKLKGMNLTSMNGLTIEKLLFIENQCINPQDAVIIRLLIEGVEVHEIIYLKKTSLDAAKKVLTITDSSGKKRRQDISQKCVEFYQSALKQAKYILYNGYNQIPEIVDLKDSDYVVKASLKDYIAHENRIQEMDSVILRTIYYRFRNLAEIFLFPELANLVRSRIQ